MKDKAIIKVTKNEIKVNGQLLDVVSAMHLILQSLSSKAHFEYGSIQEHNKVVIHLQNNRHQWDTKTHQFKLHKKDWACFAFLLKEE